jgi:hypothetical protein
MRLNVWIKMDQTNIDRMLDKHIVQYKKDQRFLFFWLSILIFVFDFAVTFTIFPATATLININSMILSILELIVIFLILETIAVVSLIIENHKFDLMNQSEKRSYLFKDIVRKANKLCPKCGHIYNINRTMCSECGGDLYMSSEYMWIEDKE